MVVCNVFSSCVYYQYKSYLFSKATAVLVVLSILTVLFPIIFTYRSHGFWLRSDVYQEQPKVEFKYDYIIFFDVAKPTKKSDDEIILCSNIPKILYMTRNKYHCPFIKTYEEDLNEDGLNDILKFETKLFLTPGQSVQGISIMLFFDYKLSSYCLAEFESAVYVQHISHLPGAGIEITGDLGLVQRQPLNPRRINLEYNKPIIVQKEIGGKPLMMGDILMEYSLRNLSTQLTNVYTSWISRRVDSEPFTVEMTIIYSEATVRYIPTTWQVLRFAWAQFFPVLMISVYIFKSIKEFIFSNQLVKTYREEPRTKDN